MKKLLLLLAVVFVSLGAAMAQQTQKKTNKFSVNVGYNIGLNKGSGGMFFLQPEYGKYFTDQFYLGIGTGISTDDGFNALSIPAFMRAEIDFQADKLTPYISLQGGYDFNVSGLSGTGMGRISPTVGVKVPVSRHTICNLGFGYTRTIVAGGGGDYLGFNVGLMFNSGGRGFVNFMKKFEYSFELETMLPVSGPMEKHGDTQWQEKMTSFIGFRFSGIMPTGLKNLYAGYSIGIGRYKEETVLESKYESHSNDLHSGYLNVMARAKYKVKQLSITDKIYPFAQVDMGFAASNDFDFAVHPAVGISIMTSKEHSIDISAGYYTVSFDDIDNTSKGTLRIAAGYTF